MVFTVSVDGKEASSVMSVDFEEALGRCDVRTIPSCPSCACDWEHLDVAVLPGSCPANRFVHALRLVVSCATSLSLSVWIVLSTNGGFVLQWGGGGGDTF